MNEQINRIQSLVNEQKHNHQMEKKKKAAEKKT